MWFHQVHAKEQRNTKVSKGHYLDRICNVHESRLAGQTRPVVEIPTRLQQMMEQMSIKIQGPFWGLQILGVQANLQFDVRETAMYSWMKKRF